MHIYLKGSLLIPTQCPEEWPMSAPQQREYSMWAQSCLLQAPKPAISADELHLPESKQSVPYVISECPRQWSQFTVGDLHPSAGLLGTLAVHAPSVLVLWMRPCHSLKNNVLRSESRCFPVNNAPLWNRHSACPLLIFMWVHRGCGLCVHSDLPLFFSFCFCFLAWLNFMVWSQGLYLVFSHFVWGRGRGKMGKILGLFQTNSLKSNVLCRKHVPSLKDYMKIQTDLP